MTVRTKRTILRRWRESDKDALYKYASDPEVGPKAGWTPHDSVEESLQVIREVFTNDYTWAIELKSTGEVIGCIAYLNQENSNIDIGKNDVEVGYWIGKPYWNQGICTEVLKEFINFCIGKVKANVIWSDYFVDNPASGRVMEKCGFKSCNTFTYCTTLYGGKDRPLLIMKLERSFLSRMGRRFFPPHDSRR